MQFLENNNFCYSAIVWNVLLSLKISYNLTVVSQINLYIKLFKIA